MKLPGELQGCLVAYQEEKKAEEKRRAAAANLEREKEKKEAAKAYRQSVIKDLIPPEWQDYVLVETFLQRRSTRIADGIDEEVDICIPDCNGKIEANSAAVHHSLERTVAYYYFDLDAEFGCSDNNIYGLLLQIKNHIGLEVEE